MKTVTNKKKQIVLLVLIIVILIGGISMIIILNKTPDVMAFDFKDYQYYIDNYSSEDNFGYISDSKDLLEKVEAAWIDRYGERIKDQKPYQVFYDEANGIWLVHGTLRSDIMGGVANILVNNDTGKVLAIWHDK